MDNNKRKNLSELEYNKIIYDWNKTESVYPKDKTIHMSFEEQSEKNPNNIALVFGNKKLSYRELNEKANQLAHCIRNTYREESDCKLNDELIGIYIDRSLEMIIGILAILKAGAAYVPFDRADPEERLKFKIKDSGCKMVLSSSGSMEALLFLAEIDTIPIAIDSYWGEIEKFSKENLVNINKSSDLAYVIYTSGSTGKPKAVMVEHKTVLNLLSFQNGIENLDFSTAVLQFASVNFDVSVQEIFSTLLFGGQLHIINESLKYNLTELVNYIHDSKIKIIFIPPAVLDLMFSSSELYDLLVKELNHIIAAGEQLQLNNRLLIKALTETKIKLHNHYGPTESHVVTTFVIDSQNCNNLKLPPIGKPISNVNVYILDANMDPVPVGISGELYIAGETLARGYLNHPKLTAERFIENPFVQDDCLVKHRNLRIYKTGDIVKWQPDGNIQYIGRNDDQIKLRGFRVELGEIENKLTGFSEIKQSVVLCKEKNGSKYIAAYYTSDNEIKSGEIKKYLDELLPEYMIPSIFVYMDKFLLNINGKIDRRSLPEPVFKRDSSNYIAPRNGIESKLCSIWQKILDIPKIGVLDDLSRLGGNSILLIRVATDMERTFNKKLSPSVLLENNTIEKQEKLILGTQNDIKVDNSLIEDLALFEQFKYIEFSQCESKGNTVLITGVTGFLGIHLLEKLILETDQKIICLIRKRENCVLKESLKEILEKYNIRLDNKQLERISLLSGNLQKEKLGVEEQDYKFLIENISDIYHCGAHVNYLLNYKTMRKANTLSTFEIIKLISFCRERVNFYFISSVSSVSETDSHGYGIESFSENLPPDNIGGYGKSKWCSEYFISHAFKSGMHGIVFRPGNIFANTVTGLTNPADSNHLLLLINSFIEYKKAPNINLNFEFVPVDTVAEAIVKSSKSKFYDKLCMNISNPYEIPLCALIKILEEIKNIKIELLSYEEWKKDVVDKIADDSTLANLKLLYGDEYCEMISSFNTKNGSSAYRSQKINLPYNYRRLLKKYFNSIY